MLLGTSCWTKRIFRSIRLLRRSNTQLPKETRKPCAIGRTREDAEQRGQKKSSGEGRCGRRLQVELVEESASESQGIAVGVDGKYVEESSVEPVEIYDCGECERRGVV